MKKKLCICFLLTFTFIVITNIGEKNALGLENINKEEINSDYIYTNELNLNYNKDELKNNELKETDLFSQSDEIVEVFNSSTKKVYLTEGDINLMAKVVFAESKGEPYTGKVAVASVILNRVTSPNFPNTVEGVITQKNAFSCVKNGVINVTPNSDSYNAVKDAINGSDPTGKALYFYNPQIATCSWMKGIEKHNIKTIGQHVFFNVK
ncbi:MAG: cell wall hydrolase [Clostridium perfringens]|nr:cell wall hydrolase [Clostridium perfringens]